MNLPRHRPSSSPLANSADEILQLILNELSNPSAFAMLSKRHHEFCKDPYVRAMYFLARYGRMQALYWALGRGKLLNEQVIDVSVLSHRHLPPLSTHPIISAARGPLAWRKSVGLVEPRAPGRRPLPFQTGRTRKRGARPSRCHVCSGCAGCLRTCP